MGTCNRRQRTARRYNWQPMRVSSWVRADRGSRRVLVQPNRLALNSPAQLVLCIRGRCSKPRRQTVEFRCVGQGGLQRAVEAPSKTLQIERTRIPALNTNTLALKRQLSFVIRCTGYAGIVAGRPALDRSRNDRFADANGQANGLYEVTAPGISPYRRLFASDRSRSSLSAASRFK